MASISTTSWPSATGPLAICSSSIGSRSALNISPRVGSARCGRKRTIFFFALTWIGPRSGGGRVGRDARGRVAAGQRALRAVAGEAHVDVEQLLLEREPEVVVL